MIGLLRDGKKTKKDLAKHHSVCLIGDLLHKHLVSIDLDDFHFS